jgi:ribosomal protein L37E
MTYCPRCGEPMTGGICNNCGFPLTKMRKRAAADNQKSDRKQFRIAL